MTSSPKPLLIVTLFLIALLSFATPSEGGREVPKRNEVYTPKGFFGDPTVNHHFPFPRATAGFQDMAALGKDDDGPIIGNDGNGAPGNNGDAGFRGYPYPTSIPFGVFGFPRIYLGFPGLPLIDIWGGWGNNPLFNWFGGQTPVGNGNDAGGETPKFP